MIEVIEASAFLRHRMDYPVIDVRSPGEYRQGHLHGSFNIPLFSDEERAIVGTLYVKTGRAQAIQRGMEIAVPKLAGYIEALDQMSPQKWIFLHCWRGGARSERMAGVFSGAGYHVILIAGGYKALRHEIRKELGRHAKVVILGGYTGSGKTDLLQALGIMGEQVIDLEGLASHRGSAFGALGLPGQPTNEQFENNLFAQWAAMDFTRTIWMEDESRMIGRVTLPDPVISQISNNPMILAEIPNSVRTARLVQEYARFDKRLLAASLFRISERLGGQRTRDALRALEEDRFSDVTEIVLAYYDKAYRFSMARRKSPQVYPIELDGLDAKKDAGKIIEMVRNTSIYGTDLP